MTHAIPKIIRVGAVALTFSAAAVAQNAATPNQPAPATANDTYQKQSQGNRVGADPSTLPTSPAANPGFGTPAKNPTSGESPYSNSTYQKDRNGSQGFDLGWIGLLGLAGLFGLGRGSSRNRDMSHSAENVRSR